MCYRGTVVRNREASIRYKENPMVAAFGTGQVFWSMVYFFLFFIWIWLLITIFADIFRSDDLSGWGKALWTIFVIFLPYLGVFVYLIARGQKMGEHAVRDAKRQDDQMRAYVQSVSGPGTSTADQIAKLHELQVKGAITEEEFQAQKAKLLA